MRKKRNPRRFDPSRGIGGKRDGTPHGQIQKDLEDMVGEKGGIKRSLYLDEIQKYLNETHQCKQSVHTVESATGKYAVCIESWRHVNGDPDSLRKEVTINSRGYVDGKWKELKATILVGASDIPDALNYALGAHRSCSGNKDCIVGEGNLFLHGGAEIYGDMKVDGNIITSNRAHAILSNKSVWVESLFPSVFPGPKSKEARLILGGDIYTFSHPPNSYDAHIKNNRFSSGIYKELFAMYLFLLNCRKNIGVSPFDVAGIFD